MNFCFQYEFKAKGIKKKKTILEISVDGVKVSIRKKKARTSVIHFWHSIITPFVCWHFVINLQCMYREPASILDPQRLALRSRLRSGPI